MCHLRKVTHQEEGLWETTAPRLLPDMRFWLVSDVDWGQGKQCNNRWWLDRTKADMPAFSRGAVAWNCSRSYFRDGGVCPPRTVAKSDPKPILWHILPPRQYGGQVARLCHESASTSFPKA